MSATLEPVEKTELIVRPMVIPWAAEKDNLPPNILSKIFRRLQADDILGDLVPECSITEEQFIEFVNGPALLSLFFDLESARYCGLAWITNVEEGDLIKKGCASIGFFREWWKPKVTEIFGKIVLSHWFHILGMNIVYGLTPVSNRLAMRYSKRVGFQYRAVLPNFTSRRGEICDAAICMITREEFDAQN